MPDTKKIGVVAFTRQVAMVHPHLFEPHQFKKEGQKPGDPAYSAGFIFTTDNPDFMSVKKAIAEVAKAKNPGADVPAIIKATLKSGTKEADKAKLGGKYDAEYLRDTYIVNAKTGVKVLPQLGVWDTGDNVQAIDKSKVDKGILTLSTEELRTRYKDLFFFGAEVHAEVVFHWYDGFGGGVSAYLQKVVATGAGTRRYGGQSTMGEAFGGVAGSVTGVDPTKSAAAQSSAPDEFSVE